LRFSKYSKKVGLKTSSKLFDTRKMKTWNKTMWEMGLAEGESEDFLNDDGIGAF